MRAALIAEGPSDRGLTRVRERLCRKLGVGEIEVEWANEVLQLVGAGTTVEAKVRELLRADPDFDLVFVHRDGDKPGLEARREEIRAASTRVGAPWPLVPVIPVREMEAWLLVDEQQLRSVVGNAKGAASLALPKLSQVEACTDPKQVLRVALTLARRKSRKAKSTTLSGAEFGRYRARLLEELDIEGPVSELAAWQALVEVLEVTLDEIRLCEIGEQQPPS